MQGAEEIGEFLPGPTQPVLGEQPTAGPQFHQSDLFRRAENSPHLVELPGQQPAEYRVHVAGGVEIASPAELLGIPRVVTEIGIVKAELDIVREGNRSALPDFLLNLQP